MFGPGSQGFERKMHAHRRCIGVPVDGDGFDVGRLLHQPLVAQVAQHQPVGVGTQGHQGDQLALVQVDGQRAFGRDVDHAYLTVLIHCLHRRGQRSVAAHEQARHRAGRQWMHGGHTET